MSRRTSLRYSKREPMLSGYLIKRGKGNKRWKRRFFKQEEYRLIYADSESAARPLGFINLLEVTHVRSSSEPYPKKDPKGPNLCFEVITPDRIYYMAGEDEAARDYWLVGLNTFLKNEEEKANALNMLAEKDKELETLRSKVAEEQARIESLTKNESAVGLLQKENLKLSSALDELKSSLEQKESSSDGLEEKVKRLEEELESAKGEEAKKQSELLSQYELEKEESLVAAKEEAKKHEEEVASLKEALSAKENKVKELSANVDRCKSEMDRLAALVQAKDEKIELLNKNSEVRSAEVAEWQRKLEEKQKTLEDIQEKNLRGKSEEVKQLTMQLRESESNVERLKDEKSVSERKADQFSSELKLQQEKIAATKAETEQLKASFTKETENMQKKLDECAANAQKSAEAIDSKDADLARATEQLGELKKKLETLRKVQSEESNKTAAAIATLRTELDFASKERETAQEAHNAALAELGEAQHSNKELKKQLESQKAKADDAKAQLEATQTECTRLKATRDDVSAETLSLEERLKAVEQHNAELKALVQQKETDLTDAQKEAQYQSKAVKQMHSELNTLRTSFGEERNALKAKAESEVSELRSEISALESAKKQLEAKVAQSAREEQQKERSLSDLQRRFNEMQQLLQEKDAEVKRITDKLAEGTSDAGAAINKMREHQEKYLAELHEEKETLAAQVDRQRQQADQLQKDLEAARARVKTLQEERQTKAKTHDEEGEHNSNGKTHGSSLATLLEKGKSEGEPETSTTEAEEKEKEKTRSGSGSSMEQLRDQWANELNNLTSLTASSNKEMAAMAAAYDTMLARSPLGKDGDPTTGGAGSRADSHLLDLKMLSRESLERQVKRYRKALDHERSSSQEMRDQHDQLEEELMETKLSLEAEKRKVQMLELEKESLENYVAELADDMAQETSTMTALKEQFQEEIGVDSLGLPPDGSEASVSRRRERRMSVDTSSLEADLAFKEEELKAAKAAIHQLEREVQNAHRKYEGEIIMLRVDCQRARQEAEKARTRLEEEQKKFKERADEEEDKQMLLGRLRAVEKELRLQEKRNEDQAAERATAVEQLRIKADQLKYLEEAQEQQKQLMAVKDKALHSASSEVKELQRRMAALLKQEEQKEAARTTTKAGGTPSPSSSPVVAAIAATAIPREEHDKVKEQLIATKGQNELLSSELERLEKAFNAQLAAKEATLDNARVELSSVREAYKDLRQKVLLTEDEDKSLAEELEEVKRELFFSTAMSVKLNFSMEGRAVNQNISSLYDMVLEEGLPYKHWNNWIHLKLSQAANDSDRQSRRTGSFGFWGRRDRSKTTAAPGGNSKAKGRKGK